MTPDLLAAQAARLGEDAYRYSPRQLYYACCAAVEQPPPSATRGIVGCSALLILLAAALVRVATTPPVSVILALVGAAGLLLALLNAHAERAQARERALQPRPLAESYDAFAGGPLRRGLAERPEALSGLVGGPGSAGPPDPATAPAGAAPGVRAGRGRRRALVVCDRQETAALVRANLAHLPSGTEVVDASTPGGGRPLPWAGARLRVIALHDADPSGCALPARLRATGATRVVDAGLRPPVGDVGLQVIQGAPARVPPELEAELGAAQLAWLASGRRLELATLTPREVVELVRTALEEGDAVAARRAARAAPAAASAPRS
jgi:hypothetical protein